MPGKRKPSKKGGAKKGNVKSKQSEVFDEVAVDSATPDADIRASARGGIRPGRGGGIRPGSGSPGIRPGSGDPGIRPGSGDPGIRPGARDGIRPGGGEAISPSSNSVGTSLGSGGGISPGGGGGISPGGGGGISPGGGGGGGISPGGGGGISPGGGGGIIPSPGVNFNLGAAPSVAPINVIVDLSHHNKNLNFQKAAAAGIVGVIHKATQGTNFKDPTYVTNREKALDAGLLWGAYHFGVGGDGSDQADFFLNFVKPGSDTLLVLDFEANPTGSSMTLVEAREFVTHVNAVVGRFPGLYSGNFIKEKLGTKHDPILAQCFFWLAQYGPVPVVPPNWPFFTLWQYTDGANGPEPHTVNGIGRCDRDKFNGDLESLKELWGVAT